MSTSPTQRAEVIVVGAGVLGAWSALHLARRGVDVLLVEALSPGHVRASSGGESRLIRCGHGDDLQFTRMAQRSLAAWDALSDESGRRLLVRTGVAWFAARQDGWEAASAETLRAVGVRFELLAPEAATDLFPSLRTDDLEMVLHEPDSGILHARVAVQTCVEVARRHGLRLLTGRATPAEGGVDVDGTTVHADRVVWACGPWLPDLLGAALEPLRFRVTKQDVVFFGAGPEWSSPPVPGWIDYDSAAYGVGDLDGRGFKCAPDVEGPDFDPDRGERALSPDNERRAREYLAHRFPALADAPVIGHRTCQYSLTADTSFLIAPHPERKGEWVVGGGSGHAFKHGPVIGEHVADLVTGAAEPDPRFALAPRRADRSLRTAGGLSTG